MKRYIWPTLVTFVLASALYWAFMTWRARNLASDGFERIDRVDQLETQGVPESLVFKTTEGKEVAFSSLKGKVVILNFWASWCAPCVEELPSMIRLVEELKGEVVLVAVSQDSNIDEMQKFLKAFPRIYQPDILLVFDEGHRLGRSFNADRLPESFIFKKDGLLARKIVGSIDWHTPDAVAYMKDLAKP